jgi:aspartate racemase
MKTIGIIGGMSWESTAEYYAILNEYVKDVLGTFHSAKIILHSLDFAEIEALQQKADWESMANLMVESALKLQNAGADLLIIATNTMHKLVPQIEYVISIPLIHIADATGNAIINKSLNKMALLGTRFTMQEDFYKKRLNDKFKIDIILPEIEEQNIIHEVIYRELVRGILDEKSKIAFLEIINKLKNRGAQGIILGCTEIPLLINQKDTEIPLFNTTRLHAEFAAQLALA